MQTELSLFIFSRPSEWTCQTSVSAHTSHLLTSSLTSWFYSVTVPNNTHTHSWGYWWCCHQLWVPWCWGLRMWAGMDFGNQNIRYLSVMLLSIWETGGHWTVTAKARQTLSAFALHSWKQLHCFQCRMCTTPTRSCEVLSWAAEPGWRILGISNIHRC